eukprot:XP_017446869.1 PREDICTED: uncharacterized protein LOC678817 isoform X1 [Rattus norvegicus]
METIESEEVGGVQQHVVCQGPVILKRGWKSNKRYLILLNNLLIVSNRQKRKKFKIKHVIPLTHLWLGDEVDIFRTDNSSASRSIYLYWPMGNAVATFRSMEQTIWWYFFLQRSIREVKKQNKIDLSMQILTEDIACSDTPLYVPATNFDTGNDIISKLLPMMTKHNIEDYQLWFCPGHGKAPRPLQGHEYPHDIMMINVQKNFRPQELRNFTSINSLPQLFKKYLTSDAQGQFILKPRDSERILQEKNINGKTLKKPKTSITSWWHRYSVRHQDQVCSSPRVNKGGKLFGRELSSICHDNKLPSAILDMLSLLKRKGPTTKGVFTVSPSVTLRQTVKDKLDSDEEVDMNKQSVHVVAWIFKDFLQNIEGSLMTSKLYDEWIAVTEKINEEEKLAAVQSLLEKLPTANAALLGQLFQILFEVKSNSSVNGMSSYQLSCGIAPCLLFMPSSCNNGGTNDIAKKISLTTFMIENARKLFGEDLVEVWYETSLFHPPGEKSSRSQNTATNTSTMKEVERGHSSCPSGKTCTHGYDALPRSAADHHPYEGITDSEKQQGSSVYASPPGPSINPPQTTKKCLFGKTLRSIFEDEKVSGLIFDMMSIIAEKGQDSDDIFKIIPENSHWSLRNKIDSEQYINWNQESVIIIASVLMNFIRSIDGSLLTSDLYEKWFSVLDEGTVIEKFIAIQSLLVKIPPENLTLLYHLISVLAIIKDSSMNNLDSDRLALRIAPYLLRDETTRNSPFLQDISRKMSIIQIMIDNYLLIFGNYPTYGKHIDKRSDGLKTSTDSIKFADKSPIIEEFIVGINGKSCDNDENFNISYAALKKEGPTDSEKQQGSSVCASPPGPPINPPQTTKKCLFGKTLRSIFEDKKVSGLILDMLSIIAKKGQESDDLFKIVHENSHFSLRNRIDSEQCIDWNVESVLDIASVFKVRQLFESTTLSIPQEMHMCFLSVRLNEMTGSWNFGPINRKKFNIFFIPLCYSSASKFPLFRFTIQDIVVLQMCGSLIMQAYPYPTQDMLSIIAKKGQESDDLFKIVHENSHFSLRNRIDSEQCIDWNVESVLDIASVFKDFIKNIDGSLLTSDLYENWLSVMDEGTVAGRITAIQRLLLRIPQENFSVLNHLISVLVIIKDSSMNNLNSKRLSIRIAPYALWDRTRRGSLFGSDMSIKISLMQIMIDNYIPIFENDNKYCSDGLKTSADFINSSGKSPIMKEVIGDHNGKTCDDEEFDISYTIL